MIQYLSETGSTNADIAKRLRNGELVPEGAWLIADRQTAGSGRQGRDWLDGAGNFMGSTVVHPGFGDPAPGSLALLAGLAVFEVVSPYLSGLSDGAPILKWPNDLMIGRAKLAGILLEREGDAVIVGIGVNLAFAPIVPDREVVALSDFGPAPDRNVFAQALSHQFTIELERWRNFGLESIINRWLAAAHSIGTPLQTDGVRGTFAGLSPEGHMQLRLEDGTLQSIASGEVNLAD